MVDPHTGTTGYEASSSIALVDEGLSTSSSTTPAGVKEIEHVFGPRWL
jgi:hypothetical protein